MKHRSPPRARLDTGPGVGHDGIVRRLAYIGPVLAFVAACSPDEFTSTTDAGSEAALPDVVVADREAGPPACDRAAPLGKPTLVQWKAKPADLPSPMIGIVRFTPDLQTAVFDEGTDGIFRATLENGTYVGHVPLLQQLVGTAFHPTISAGGRILFARSPTAVTKSAIYEVGDVAPFYTSTGTDLKFPYLLANGSAMYFWSETGVTTHIARLAPPSGTATPNPLPSIPLEATQVAVSDDELLLYYGTGNTAATSHVYEMKRASLGAEWSNPSELFSKGFRLETASYLTPDGCTLFMRAYDESNGGTDRALYMMKRN